MGSFPLLNEADIFCSSQSHLHSFLLHVYYHVTTNRNLWCQILCLIINAHRQTHKHMDKCYSKLPFGWQKKVVLSRKFKNYFDDLLYKFTIFEIWKFHWDSHSWRNAYLFSKNLLLKNCKYLGTKSTVIIYLLELYNSMVNLWKGSKSKKFGKFPIPKFCFF